MDQNVEFLTSPSKYWVNASLSVPFKLKSWPNYFKNDAFQSTIICTPCNQFNRLRIHHDPKLVCILSPGFDACAFCIMMNCQDECLTKKQILLQTKSTTPQAVQIESKSAFDNEGEERECEDDAVENLRVVTSGEKRQSESDLVKSGKKVRFDDGGFMVPVSEREKNEKEVNKHVLNDQQSTQKKDLEVEICKKGVKSMTIQKITTSKQ